MHCLAVISNRLTAHATICYLKNVDLVIFISLCYRHTLFHCQTPLYGVRVHKTDVDLQPSVVSLVLLIVHHHLSLLFSWRMGLSICVFCRYFCLPPWLGFKMFSLLVDHSSPRLSWRPLRHLPLGARPCY